MNRYYLMLLAACMFAISSACNDDEDEPKCGTAMTFTGSLADDFYWYDLDAVTGHRELIYEADSVPEPICTEEVTSAMFTVVPATSDPLPDSVQLWCHALWAGTYNVQMRLVRTTDGVYVGEIRDISLKEAFGDIPAWIDLQLRFVFPSQGNISVDKNYLESLLSGMRVNYTYHEALP